MGLDVIREQTETVFSDEPQTEIVQLSYIGGSIKESENINDTPDGTMRTFNLNKIRS